MRIYLPATMSVVRRALAAGAVPVRSGVGFAVTGPLRLEYPDWSEEDLEYLAMQDAGRASLRLLAAEAAGQPAAGGHRRRCGRRAGDPASRGATARSSR